MDFSGTPMEPHICIHMPVIKREHSLGNEWLLFVEFCIINIRDGARDGREKLFKGLATLVKDWSSIYC